MGKLLFWKFCIMSAFCVTDLAAPVMHLEDLDLAVMVVVQDGISPRH